ncbi:MAG: hypothetical protein V1731_03425 [Candidatus Aenigmatarchaeota archaeon]
MVMATLKGIRTAVSDVLEGYDNRTRQILGERGFEQRARCSHTESAVGAASPTSVMFMCYKTLYVNDKEIFVVGDLETFYRGPYKFGGTAGPYEECPMAKRREKPCDIPFISGEGEWISTADLLKKLRERYSKSA